MIKPILTVIFLFALSAQGKTINCYVCTADRNDDTYPQCKDPLEGSHTETVDSNEDSCFTLFFIVITKLNGPITWYNFTYTLRGHSGIFHKKGAVRSKEHSRSCDECQSDKCNTHIGHESDSNELDSYESDWHDGTKRPNSGGRGKTIDCYVCTTDRNDNTKPQCKDPLEGSHTETVDSSEKSCFTMTLKGSIEDNGLTMNYNFTVRGHSDINRCSEKKARKNPMIMRNVYECKSDKCNTCTEGDLIKCYSNDPTECNSATSIHVSFIMLLGLFAFLYVLRN